MDQSRSELYPQISISRELFQNVFNVLFAYTFVVDQAMSFRYFRLEEIPNFAILLAKFLQLFESEHCDPRNYFQKIFLTFKLLLRMLHRNPVIFFSLFFSTDPKRNEITRKIYIWVFYNMFAILNKCIFTNYRSSQQSKKTLCKTPFGNVLRCS